MTENDRITCWGFDLDDSWTAAALRHVDRALCGMIDIEINGEGDFVMKWKEENPELGDWEDFFGDEKRTDGRVKKWVDMLKRLPSSEHEIELTQAEAYEVFVRASLPPELHSYAGLD